MTVFARSMQTWYENRNFEEAVTLRIFSIMESTLGAHGLAGLNKILGFKAKITWQNFVDFQEKQIFRDKFWVEMLVNLGKINSTKEHSKSSTY